MEIKLPIPLRDLQRRENGGVLPNGTVYPQVTGPDSLTTYPNTLERVVAAHQRNSGSMIQFKPQLHYVLDVKQFQHYFHSDAPYGKGTTMWGYDGKFPGPTFVSRHGVPILVRIINNLFDDPKADPSHNDPQTVDRRTIFGDTRISTHLHNGHTGSESDGNPFDIFPPNDPRPHPPYPASIQAIRFRDHHYPMFRAGLNLDQSANMPPPNVNTGDISEGISTLWYHDHSDHYTSENVYKGLAGFHLVFDELDSGDEKDRAPCALKLPSGDFDIPMLFQDKRFNDDGQLILNLNAPGAPDNSGFLGDVFTVNGAIKPKVSVLRRKYRLRLLNAGPARFYEFFLSWQNPDTMKVEDHEFTFIGNDQSLLPKPLRNRKSVIVSVAERADIVVDFSKFKVGTKIYLENRLIMIEDGRGPDFDFDENTGKFIKFKTVDTGGDRILMFEVKDDAVDSPPVPDDLRPNTLLPSYIPQPLTEADLPGLRARKNFRQFDFERDLVSRKWTINKQEFDPQVPAEIFRPVRDPADPRKFLDGYVLCIKNEGGFDWSHPVHIHLEEFRILMRDGIATDPVTNTESCKKDVLLLRPSEEVWLFVRFRDFLGRYPIHCHNVVHEDHTMMLRFDVTG